MGAESTSSTIGRHPEVPLLLALLAACAEDPRTLDTCGGSASSDVPSFFATYFRCADLSVNGDTLIARTVDLPPHPSPYYGRFDPNWEKWDDRGGEWVQNPNTIREQAVTLDIPLEPTSRGITVTEDLVDYTPETSGFEYAVSPAGLGLDGVVLFDGMAAPGDDIRQERYTFDTWEGHPDVAGVYHHHSATPGPLAVLDALGLVTTTTPGEAEVELFGVMCDGTLVFGCTELDGLLPTTQDFDAQAGHVHDIVDADGEVQLSGRYHVHVCEALHEHAFTPEIQFYEGCG